MVFVNQSGYKTVPVPDDGSCRDHMPVNKQYHQFDNVTRPLLLVKQSKLPGLKSGFDKGLFLKKGCSLAKNDVVWRFSGYLTADRDQLNNDDQSGRPSWALAIASYDDESDKEKMFLVVQSTETVKGVSMSNLRYYSYV